MCLPVTVLFITNVYPAINMTNVISTYGMQAYCANIYVNRLIHTVIRESLRMNSVKLTLFKLYLTSVLLIFISFKTKIIDSKIPISMARILIDSPPNQSDKNAVLRSEE